MAAPANTPSLTHDEERRRKLPRLPQDVRITKRPLIRPVIASPHAGASQPKVVYVAVRTPFLSAVKRVEKLLRLAEKRVVQSASVHAQQNRRRRNKRSREEGENEIDGIAAEVERRKGDGKKRRLGVDGDAEMNDDAPIEEVAIKGTGKAIAKVMEMALWFQERSDVYQTHLRTDTVIAIDDVEVPEPEGEGKEDAESRSEIPETRVRYTSVLEVRVSLC